MAQSRSVRASRKIQKHLREVEGLEKDQILLNRRDLGWGRPTWTCQIIAEEASHEWALTAAEWINSDKDLNPAGFGSHVLAEPYNGFVLNIYNEEV